LKRSHTTPAAFHNSSTARGLSLFICALNFEKASSIGFRKKIYETIEQLQIDLDHWIEYYNNERTHQGKVREGRTPMQTLVDGKRIWKEKIVS
jgi:hypothetical protein